MSLIKKIEPAAAAVDGFYKHLKLKNFKKRDETRGVW
jgi:hypothetical protein